ncbi:hypothetical protein BDW69DRAFT_160947 [Aspergillus filifer]
MGLTPFGVLAGGFPLRFPILGLPLSTVNTQHHVSCLAIHWPNELVMAYYWNQSLSVLAQDTATLPFYTNNILNDCP